MAAHHHHDHDAHVHLDEADWAAQTETATAEGELMLGFLTTAIAEAVLIRGDGQGPVRRVLDVGSGPGVGTTELARLFPNAEVTALDASPAMLARAVERGRASGHSARIRTHQAELPGGLEGIDTVDVIWASMSLHHVGDVTAALRALGGALAPGGVLVVAEMADRLRYLPDDVDTERPGLIDRIDTAQAAWFASMRAGLTDHGQGHDAPTGAGDDDVIDSLRAGGFDVLVDRVDREDYPAPLSELARRVAVVQVRRVREHVGETLDVDDRRVLDALGDEDDPRSLARRDDVSMSASRRIIIARVAT